MKLSKGMSNVQDSYNMTPHSKIFKSNEINQNLTQHTENVSLLLSQVHFHVGNCEKTPQTYGILVGTLYIFVTPWWYYNKPHETGMKI